METAHEILHKISALVSVWAITFFLLSTAESWEPPQSPASLWRFAMFCCGRMVLLVFISAFLLMSILVTPVAVGEILSLAGLQ